MAGTIDKETFQRLTILYLIGQFPNGVFSSFRLQKVLYYATRDVEPRPFTFHHREDGPYSLDMAGQLLLMLESGILQREAWHSAFSGALWRAGDDVNAEELASALESCFPQLAASIAEFAAELGFLQYLELKARLSDDPVLKRKQVGRRLIQGCPGQRVAVALDEEVAEDYDMALSSHFISMMNMLPDLERAHGALPAEWAPH